MSSSDQIEFIYKLGNEYPYDDSNDGDWAVRAARGVVADLTDRRGIKQGFNDIDPVVRAEIIQTMADIIRFAYSQAETE